MVNGVAIVNFVGLRLPLPRYDRLSSAAPWTDTELSAGRPRLAIRGYATQRLIGRQDRKPSESAKVARGHDYDCPARWRSIEENAAIVSGIAALSKDPLPFLGRKDAFAGKLPIQQVYFLSFVTI